MSDLIDFDSPGTSSTGVPLLASPLIPSPEAGPPVFTEVRRSIENNPFDMVLKKITEYERNKEDPFERVIEKAKGQVLIASDDDFVKKRLRHSDVLKLNKTLDETVSKVNVSLRDENNDLVTGVNDISIITDLNNTNLIADSDGDKPDVVAWGCDRKIVPELNVSPLSCDADLSILNQSAMNDSLLDDQLVKEPSMHLFLHPRSMSQSHFLSPGKVLSPKNNRRSMSVTDAPKNSISTNDSTMASAQSSLFEDPFNNAFRTSFKNSTSSNSSCFNSFNNLSVNKQRAERLNSDSSVFSGLSNISAITTDPFSKARQDRFCSESSTCSNISNLSIIPNNTVTSCDLSVFVNDTLNKGFVTSRSQLSSTSSVTSGKTPSKTADTSDLIKKFYQIKSRMSTSQIIPRNHDDMLESEKNNFSLKSEILTKDGNSQNIEEKLIDVGNNSASVSNNETGINDIIFHEARTLAETFEKMASSKDSNITEDDLLFSKTQLNFDDLPSSDDEAVNNLIELSGGESEIVKESDTKPNVISSKDEIKALESEFVENKDPNKKAAAATLLLDLEKLIKEQDNPDAFKVLTDLQKMLGVECDNNTEILQVCLQNSMSPEDDKKFKSEKDLNTSITNNIVESNKFSNLTCNNEKNVKEKSENKSSNSSNDITDLNVENESKDVISDNLNSQSNSQKEPKEQKNVDVTSEDQKLALNLLQTLNKIVSKNNEDSAVDVLKSLGTVLSMASELRTKNKGNQPSEIKENNKSKVPKQLNRSISSLYKSPSKQHLAVKKTQNASFETLPLRRSISVNPAYTDNSNNLLNVSNKNKRKSHLLNSKKRFPSDPGFADVADKKKIETLSVAMPKPTFGTGKPIIEPIKTKLKKKPTNEVVNKRGPMKAIIPLGSMQKQNSNRATNENGLVTPPPKTQESVPSIKIISSTPNSSSNSKSKPAASSTPNMNGSRTQRVKSTSQNSSKGTATYSLSPVSLNSSSKTNSGKKIGQSRSPNKRLSTPHKNDSVDSSRLPRYSPRPVRVRKYSFSDTKSSKSPQLSSGSFKLATEKTQRHSSVLSPLRNCNKLATKAKPLSLMPKLNRSSSAKMGPEKENYA